MIHLICENCAYQIAVREEELFDNTTCSLCDGRMVLEVRETKVETDNTSIMLDNVGVDQMSRDIDMIGSAKMWETIESMTSASARLKYRKYFKVALGIVPDGESILEERNDKLYIKEIKNE